jgi:uncharacterized protein YciI
MYYVIYCEDKDDSFERRRSVRPAHLKRLEELERDNRLLLAGPMMKSDDANPIIAGMKGSLIVAEFDTLEAATSWAAADPYVTADVYARVSIYPFKKVFPSN